jgi:hypothetical protein
MFLNFKTKLLSHELGELHVFQLGWGQRLRPFELALGHANIESYYRIYLFPIKLAIVFSSWAPTPCQGANGPVRIHPHDPQAPPLHGEAPILIGVKHLHGRGNNRI